MARSISFRWQIPTSSSMIASTRLTESLSSSKIRNSSLITRSTRTSRTKSYIGSLLSLSSISSSTQAQSPFSHTARQAQVKHSRCRASRIMLCRTCLSVVSTTGKTTKEILPWLFLCTKFTEEKFMTCSTTTRCWESWRTKIRRFRFRD